MRLCETSPFALFALALDRFAVDLVSSSRRHQGHVPWEGANIASSLITICLGSITCTLFQPRQHFPSVSSLSSLPASTPTAPNTWPASVSSWLRKLGHASADHATTSRQSQTPHQASQEAFRPAMPKKKATQGKTRRTEAAARRPRGDIVKRGIEARGIMSHHSGVRQKRPHHPFTATASDIDWTEETAPAPAPALGLFHGDCLGERAVAARSPGGGALAHCHHRMLGHPDLSKPPSHSALPRRIKVGRMAAVSLPVVFHSVGYHLAERRRQ